MLATLLFFGSSVFAEESSSATASQSTDVNTGSKACKQQTPCKKHLRHHQKSIKGNKTPTAKK